MTQQMTKAELIAWVAGLEKLCEEPLVAEARPAQEVCRRFALATARLYPYHLESCACKGTGKVPMFPQLWLQDEVSGVRVPHVTLETLLPALRNPQASLEIGVDYASRYGWEVKIGGNVPTHYAARPGFSLMASGDDLYDLLWMMRRAYYGAGSVRLVH